MIGREKINNLRFSDDTTLCAKSKVEMRQLIKEIENVSIEHVLIINKRKTKMLVFDKG